MTTNYLTKIKGGCHIDDLTGCWHWRGAMSQNKYPRISAPDHTRGGGMFTQTGARAVWHAHTGKAIPEGHRVYHKGCSTNTCINPAHLACGPTGDWGKQVATHGNWRGQPARIKANRAIGRKRSAVTPAIAAEIVHSSETGVALAKRLQIKQSVISRVRRGNHMATRPNNPFAGLMPS